MWRQRRQVMDKVLEKLEARLGYKRDWTWIREATERSMVTLEEVQRSIMTQIQKSVDRPIISHSPQKSALYGGVQRRNPLKKSHWKCFINYVPWWTGNLPGCTPPLIQGPLEAPAPLQTCKEKVSIENGWTSNVENVEESVLVRLDQKWSVPSCKTNTPKYPDHLPQWNMAMAASFCGDAIILQEQGGWWELME